MTDIKIVYCEGWYPEEKDGSGTFRWMSKEAVCVLKNCQASGQKYLFLEAGHSFPDQEWPVLEVSIDGEKKDSVKIKNVLSPYFFAFEGEGDITVSFKLDRIYRVPDDTRNLGIMVTALRIITSEERQLIYGEGWHEWEYDEFFPFRWMSKKARVFLPGGEIKKNSYITFSVFSEFADFSQMLQVSLGKKILAQVFLLHNWNFYSFPLRESGNEHSGSEDVDSYDLNFSLNKCFADENHPTDSRGLGVRIGRIEFHNDEKAHEIFLFFHKNALLNYQEMLEGKTELESFPLNIGIDIYAKCNISPHCVYCPWDRLKEEEGEYANVVVDEKTLEDFGSFFQAARLLINCSIGEPLLHPRLAEILEFCAKNKKIMEISTNGQAFTERTIKALVGKPIYLYISLDAATKETYAKIRNDHWDSIVPNLIRLNEERKKNGNLPKIHMVFMPMKVNKHELEEYFQLCQKIQANALIIRPLMYLNDPKVKEFRGGYHFVYREELLSQDELKEVFRKSEEFSKKYGVPVANQFNFGKDREDRLKKGSTVNPDVPHF